MRNLPLSDPAVRVGLYMAVMFFGFGSIVPFLPRFFAEDKALTGAALGLVLAAAQLGRIVTGPLLGAWADGFADRRGPLWILPAAAFGFYLFLLAAEGPVLLFAASFLAFTCAGTMAPLAEATLLRFSAKGPVSFGAARSIGSAAFIAGTLTSGAAVGAYGPLAAVMMVMGCLAGCTLYGLTQLAPDPAPPVRQNYWGRLALTPRLLARPRFALALLAASFIQAAHAFYYNFSTLAWTAQGLSAPLIGALWGFAVTLEVAFLAFLPRIERRVSPTALLVIGGAGAVLRWAAMAASPPLALLFPLQALHALTYAATHVGAIRLLTEETPEEAAGLGMMLYTALAAGLIMGIAAIGAGWLYAHVGAGGYGAMAAMAFLGLCASGVLAFRYGRA